MDKSSAELGVDAGGGAAIFRCEDRSIERATGGEGERTGGDAKYSRSSHGA